ncbi:hypothetical protein ACFV2Z_27840 [Streptomyces sp. NPDC059688]|uniref:hypothetical protein n=1 Tax=unclassified Streptomyces TaxID=2593676 RepID=UPI00095E4177|nr:hypothetical protein [Streptomyces sp. CB01883]OKJ78967.1 hypothetical protein AMK32_29300 [Streptomyces sp. CB01883]
MQMTEDFAATAASVASAILIAATVEVSAYRKSIQNSARTGFTSYRRLSEEWRDLSPEDRRAAARSFWESDGPALGVGALKSWVTVVVACVWSVLMLAQGVVIVAGLAWLASDHPKAERLALAMLAIVACGSLMVAVVPILRVLRAPFEPFGGMWAERLIRDRAERVLADENAGAHTADGGAPSRGAAGADEPAPRTR